MDRRESTMHDAPSILPVDFGILDDDLPVPGDIEILGAHESRYLDDFFAHRGVNGHGVSPSEEGLGGVYTPNWLMPPSVVGHNVSYGYWDEGMLASMFGNEIQKQPPATAPSTYGFQTDLPAAAPLTFGYPAQPPTTTPSPVLRRQPPTAAPSNLMMPDFMTAQPQQSPNTQHSYADHQPTDDILAAASVLSHGNGAHFGMFYNQRQQNHTPVPQAPTSAHYQSATSSTAHANQNRPSVLDGMVYHNPQTGGQPYTRRPPPPISEVQFGSDPNFSSEKFVSQSARETTQAMVEKQMATLLCLERNESAAPTRAASPNAWAPMSPNTARRSSMISSVQLRTATHNPLTPDEPPNGESGPPTKRRRSSKPAEETRHGESSHLEISLPTDEPHPQPPPRRISEYKRRKLPEALTPEAETATTTAATKKQRKSSQTNTAKASGTGNPSSSRRKSSQAKPPREPLNENQKRENHIRSEQKRRGVISRGYDILYELVPALREGRTHKANALQRAADFIETLVAGNEKLRELLAEAGLEGDAIPGGHASAP